MPTVTRVLTYDFERRVSVMTFSRPPSTTNRLQNGQYFSGTALDVIKPDPRVFGPEAS